VRYPRVGMFQIQEGVQAGIEGLRGAAVRGLLRAFGPRIAPVVGALVEAATGTPVSGPSRGVGSSPGSIPNPARDRGLQGKDSSAVFSQGSPSKTTVYNTPYDPKFPGGPSSQHSIDTSDFTSGEETANGGIRNAGEFWRRWLQLRPETISPRNRYLIENYDRL